MAKKVALKTLPFDILIRIYEETLTIKKLRLEEQNHVIFY